MSINSCQIKFIPLDDLFNTHRFCEPTARTEEAAIGANNQNVWFSSLGTDLEVTEFVKGKPGSSTEQYETTFLNTTLDDPDFGDPLNDLHKMSVFHPKSQGNMATAAFIRDVVSQWSRDEGHDNPTGGIPSQGVSPACQQGEAPVQHCQNMNWPNDLSPFINLDSPSPGIACYQNTDRRWCGIVSSASCQAVIGWSLNDPTPSVTYADLKLFADSKTDISDCVQGTQDVRKVCPVGIKGVCSTVTKFCINAVGTNCI